jgi:hypothetical protein
MMVAFNNCGQPGDLMLQNQQQQLSIVDEPAAQTPTGINEVINSMKPALAVRATGCIMCHANIASNIITDFGFGDDYFFGGYPGRTLPAGLSNTDGKSIYGDYDFSNSDGINWGTAKLAPGTQVIVPEAPTQGLNVTESTLAKYLTNILSLNQNATQATVTEVKSVYIGAPSAARIVEVSAVNPGQLKFISSGTGKALQGLEKSDTGTYYSNKKQATIKCDGDVIVDGVVWLNQPTIQTTNGCRIYATGSVFISGPITYEDATENSNLQITSSKMVALGVGNKCSEIPYSDSIRERLQPGSESDHDRHLGYFTRDLGDPTSMLKSLKADAELVGALYDATCGPNGRDVGFERLMINAPVIHSRYQGQFKGLIISEIALLSLQALKYEFDPVFSNSKLRILPLLKPSDYLDIK